MAFARLQTRSTTTPRTVQSIYRDFLENNKLDLTPSYQRARCWKQPQNCGLINSIMRNWPTPLLTFYRLHPEEPDDAAAYARGVRYECVDGQNRLFAIRAFYTGTPLENDKGRSEPVLWEGQAALRLPGGIQLRDCMEEQQEWFYSYEIAVTVIEHRMSLAERKAMFTRLQDGTRISRAEYLKNTEHPVSQFVSRTGLRDRLLPAITGLVTGAKGEWMDLSADCITIYLNRSAAAPMDSINRNQAELRAVLKGDKVASPGTKYDMPITPADEAPLTALFDTLICILNAVRPPPETTTKVRIHKFHIVTLFLHLLTATPPPTPLLQSWFRTTYKDIVTWGKFEALEDPEIRVRLADTFTEALREDSSDTSSTEASPRRRAIPKAKRNALWARHFGSAGSGVCQCCEAPILFTRWEQAHIVAVAAGGTNDLSNLVPTCVGCNRSCGTEDLREFCVREYRTAPFLRT
jgi:hypothetical protein